MRRSEHFPFVRRAELQSGGCTLTLAFRGLMLNTTLLFLASETGDCPCSVMEPALTNTWTSSSSHPSDSLKRPVVGPGDACISAGRLARAPAAPSHLHSGSQLQGPASPVLSVRSYSSLFLEGKVIKVTQKTLTVLM